MFAVFTTPDQRFTSSAMRAASSSDVLPMATLESAFIRALKSSDAAI